MRWKNGEEHGHEGDNQMTDEELLLAIHNQCETTRQAIGVNYKPCAEIYKEILFLVSLLVAYLIKYR